jgi:hypothetical protein
MAVIDFDCDGQGRKERDPAIAGSRFAFAVRIDRLPLIEGVARRSERLAEAGIGLDPERCQLIKG